MTYKYAMSSGHLIDIDNFNIDDVKIEDIAHHLAKIERYNGALPINVSYTIGEHSISLANYFYNLPRNVEPYANDLAKLALLHDASEAYLSDVVSPVKAQLPDYLKLEERIQTVIFRKFGLDKLAYLYPKVQICDKKIVLDEVITLMPSKLSIYQSQIDVKPLNCRVEHNNHASATKQCFLTFAKNLGLL